MLTREENELINRVEPGTPLGEVMRRYWIPALLSDEIPEPDCPYYKADGKIHRCFMTWGIPKIYKAMPDPERRIVGIFAPIGMLVLTLFPVYWLWFEWELLLLYSLSIVVLLTSIGLNECPRCLNFERGHNKVPEEVWNTYLQKVT